MFKDIFILLAVIIIAAPYVPAAWEFANEYSNFAHGVVSYLLITVAMAFSKSDKTA